MSSPERIQAIVSIAFERLPRNLRTSFEASHDRAIITRVIKETTTRGRVTYDVHFVDPDGEPHHAVIPGVRTRAWPKP